MHNESELLPELFSWTTAKRNRKDIRGPIVQVESGCGMKPLVLLAGKLALESS